MTSHHPNPDPTTIQLEEAFTRLEEILNLLNAGSVTLDDSLKLYEEADQLIRVCSNRLNQAERKIELLVKNRQNELVIDENDKPLTQDYKTASI